MNPWMNVLIFVLQFCGVIFIGIGLSMVWTPLALIYAGAVEFALGHLLYKAMKSEESKNESFGRNQ